MDKRNAEERIAEFKMRIEQGFVTVHVEMPWKWLLIFSLALLMRFLPEFWETIRLALSMVK